MTARCACGRQFRAHSLGAARCPTCTHERSGEADLALAEEAWRCGYDAGWSQSRLTYAAFERLARQLEALPVRDLLSLCHPDRHDNSSAANAVTRALLELRDTARELVA